jgi:hypothetical protein
MASNRLRKLIIILRFQEKTGQSRLVFPSNRNLAVKLLQKISNMLKLILCLFVLLSAELAFSQSSNHKSPAQLKTEELTTLYNLDESQQKAMLEIQERKYRNLAEVEPLKQSDPAVYLQKIRGMQHANDAAMRQLLNEDQEKVYAQAQISLRQRKATAYKALKDTQTSSQEIEWKLIAFDLEALQ